MFTIEISPDAPVIAKQQILIPGKPESVWNVLTDIEQWPTWQRAVTHAKLLGEVKSGTPFRWKASGVTLHSNIHTCIPFRYFGWTGKTIGASAVHNWRFDEHGDETLVNVEETLSGFLPRLFSGKFQKDLEKGMKENLDDLLAACLAKRRG
jgi:hypothetical protein